jgi:hypothetical protein
MQLGILIDQLPYCFMQRARTVTDFRPLWNEVHRFYTRGKTAIISDARETQEL